VVSFLEDTLLVATQCISAHVGGTRKEDVFFLFLAQRRYICVVTRSDKMNATYNRSHTWHEEPKTPTLGGMTSVSFMIYSEPLISLSIGQ
jgi:hypothetical protein